jgi:hypothetical protein
MPYIAIVHVPDHTTAQRFIEKMEQTPDMERVVALFDYPTKVQLTCTGSCARKGMSAWGRDRRGFVKCIVCGKRNRSMRQWLLGSLFDFLGANLYEDAPAAFRTPEGYGIPPANND